MMSSAAVMPLVKSVLRFCERLGCGHVFGLFARGLRPAGPDDSSAWLFASITVSHAIRCRQCIWLPSLIRWFTSPLGHPRLRFAGIQRYTARNVIDNLSLL